MRCIYSYRWRKKGMGSAREKVRSKRSGQREDAPTHSPFNSLTRPTLMDDKAECRLCFGRRKTRNTSILLKEIVLCRNLRALLRSRRYDSAGCCDQSDCLTSTERWKFLPPKASTMIHIESDWGACSPNLSLWSTTSTRFTSVLMKVTSRRNVFDCGNYFVQYTARDSFGKWSRTIAYFIEQRPRLPRAWNQANG